MSRKPDPPPSEEDLDSWLAVEEPMPGPGLRLRSSVSALRRLWRVPLATMALAVTAAGVWLWRQPAAYVSTGILWETATPAAGDPASHRGLPGFPGAEPDLLESPAMQDQAAALLRAAGTNAPSAPSPGAAAGVNIKVTQFPRSTVFQVAATGPGPAYTRAFLDTLMDGYAAWRQKAAGKAAGPPRVADAPGSGAPDKAAGTPAPPRTAAGLEAEMEAKEKALNLFKSTNSPAVLDEEARSAAGYLASLKTRLAGLELDRKLLDAAATDGNVGGTPLTNRPAQAPAATNSVTNAVAPAGPAEPSADLRNLEALKQERELLGQTLGPQHPEILKREAEIERLGERIETARRQKEAELAAAQKSRQTKIDDLLAAIKECEGRVAQATGRLAEAERLKLEAERARRAYEAAPAAAPIAGPPPVEILARASPGVRLGRPAAVPLALAALAGLVLGLGIVLAAGARDGRFASLEDVRLLLGERVLGQVPDTGAPAGGGPLPLIAPEDSRPAYAEAFRSLRSAILFLAPTPEERPKSLLVTSAVQGEGKSTIAANLARALALGGAQVLLIDADLRRGTLHERLGLERLPGLGDLLQQPAPLPRPILSILARPRPARRPGAAPDAQLIRATDLPNLFFLARGSDLDNPGDRLLSPALDQILVRLQKQFDFLLIDSCPVFAADDVTSLAPKVDGTLVVVRNRFSQPAQVREALASLCQRLAKFLGLIFNRADAAARSYYYYTDAQYHRNHVA